MKKVLIFTIISAIIMSMVGCSFGDSDEQDNTSMFSYEVPNPMEYPDYTFEGTPDTAQLRATAIQAMRDLLSIQWYVKGDLRYQNAVGKKNYVYRKNKIYAGLLYTKASTGLFHFLEYYNPNDGCFEYKGTADELKLELGTACADSVLWSMTTVCNSITGGYYPIMMVPANGFIPVGNYTFNQNIKTYHEMPTYAILENNEKEVIWESYAKTQPADLLVAAPESDHAMMIIESPTVVRYSDGRINPYSSYLVIQDQWSDGETVVVDGEVIKYTGRLNKKFTFSELYKSTYIPLTVAEFIGTKAYDKASVSVSDPTCNSLRKLPELSVESNYPLAVINIISVDSKGEKTVLARKLFNGGDTEGVPRKFDLSEMDTGKLSPKFGSTVKLEVVVSTGERFYPVEFKTYNLSF